MKTQLIIFDCDGVLVDSEPLSNQIIAEEISKLGHPLTTAEAMQIFAGGSLSVVSDFIKKNIGIEPPEDIEAVYRKRSYELFEKALQPVANIKPVLQQLKLPKCVGSNGPLHKIKFNLNLTDLYQYFDEQHLFSAYEINSWKPNPKLYLHAAEKMSVDSRHCIVVEDSIHGVQAAVSAGMRVLGYAPHDDGKRLKEAGALVFNDMAQLPDLID